MERTAVILDASTGLLFFKTDKGAVFVGAEECEQRIANLRDNDAGQEARFVVDIHDETGDIIETFGLDEEGFEVLVGEPPQSPEFYQQLDAAYWERIMAARGAA